jgi:hypothetical protein
LNQFYRNLAIWMLIALAMVFLFNTFKAQKVEHEDVSFSAFLQNVDAMALSPVLHLDALRRPGAWLWFRDSLAGGSVAHGRHLRQSAWLWERRRPPCATVCREGRVMDVAWRQRPLLCGWVPRAEP